MNLQFNNDKNSVGYRVNSLQVYEGDQVSLSGNGITAFGFNIQNTRFESCIFMSTGSGDWNIGVDLRGCNNVQFHNCTFIGFTIGIRLCAHAGYDPLTRRYFDGFGNSPNGCNDIVINNCTFTDCKTGIGFKPGGSRNVQIRRNIIRGFTAYGICVEGEQGWTSNITVADNFIRGGIPSLRGYGLYIGENVYGVTASRNNIECKSAVGADICVSTSPSQGDTPVYDVSLLYNDCNKILWCPGNTDIVGARSVGNKASIERVYYVDPTKTKGKVLYEV